MVQRCRIEYFLFWKIFLKINIHFFPPGNYLLKVSKRNCSKFVKHWQKYTTMTSITSFSYIYIVNIEQLYCVTLLMMIASHTPNSSDVASSRRIVLPRDPIGCIFFLLIHFSLPVTTLSTTRYSKLYQLETSWKLFLLIRFLYPRHHPRILEDILENVPKQVRLF